MSSQHHAQEQSPTLGSVLGHQLDRCFAIPSHLQELGGQVADLITRLEKQNTMLAELHEDLHTVSETIGALYQKQECLENASRQQAMLTEEHYASHVIEPIGRQLFPMIDHATQALSGRIKANGMAELLEGLRAQLLDVLFRLGIEPIDVEEGTPFDARTMHPLGFTDSDRRARDRTVAAVLQPGFRRGKQVLRHQGVLLYRYTSETERDPEITSVTAKRRSP